MRDFMKDLCKSPLAIVGLFWVCVAVFIALTINFPIQVILFFSGLLLITLVSMLSWMVYEMARMSLR